MRLLLDDKNRNFLNIDTNNSHKKRNFSQKNVTFVYSCNVFFCIITEVSFLFRNKEGRTRWQQMQKNAI